MPDDKRKKLLDHRELEKLREPEFSQALNRNSRLKNKILQEFAAAKGASKTDLESLIDFYREYLGIPKEHVPVELNRERLYSHNFEPLPDVLGFFRPRKILGPLNMGGIEIKKGEDLDTVWHELRHAKDWKSTDSDTYFSAKNHFLKGNDEDPGGHQTDIDQLRFLEFLTDAQKKRNKLTESAQKISDQFIWGNTDSEPHLSSVVEYFRTKLGVPEKNFPIKTTTSKYVSDFQSPEISFTEPHEPPRGVTRYKEIPGPLTIGEIELGNDPSAQEVIHQLIHAKEMMSLTKPEYESARLEKLIKGGHFLKGSENDSLGSNLEDELRIQIDKEFKDIIEKLNKK